MKKLILLIFTIAAIAVSVHASEEAAMKEDTVDLLFIQDAQSVEFHKDTMILKDAKPQVLYFSDRPQRIAGHLTREEAREIVAESFKNVPPNAVLVIFGKEKSTDIVMTLTSPPRIDGEDLVFDRIKIINGTPPQRGGANALFIDTIRARRPGNPRGPLDPRGPADPRGPRDHRGPG